MLPTRQAVARAASLLWRGVVRADGQGLVLPGREHRPVLLAELVSPADPERLLRTAGAPLPVANHAALAVAAAGLVRLAQIADRAGETLREHPDSSVRRSAALLAARAHPVLVGLGAGS